LYFDKKLVILWSLSCSSVIWALFGYSRLRSLVFVDRETVYKHFAEPSSKGATQGMRTRVCGRSLLQFV
jgi:hypothetical protein